MKNLLLLIPIALFGGAVSVSAGSYEDHLYEDGLRLWHKDSARQKAEEDARSRRWKHRNDGDERFWAAQKAKNADVASGHPGDIELSLEKL